MAVKYVNGEKCYPFNGGKHQHDIDFAITRCKNLIHDAREDGDKERELRLMKLLERYNEAFAWCSPHGVCYMPYKVWRDAKDASEWAQHERAARCSRAGVEYVC